MQIEQALRVFKGQLRWLARQSTHADSDFDDVRAWLERDGLELDENHKIHWSPPVGLEHSLHTWNDPSGIRAELQRGPPRSPRGPGRCDRGRQAARRGHRESRPARAGPARR